MQWLHAHKYQFDLFLVVKVFGHIKLIVTFWKRIGWELVLSLDFTLFAVSLSIKIQFEKQNLEALNTPNTKHVLP